MAIKVLRRRLYRVQDGKCYYCNGPMTFRDPYADSCCTIDHKVPRIRGGTISVRSYRDNVVAACRKCNQDKDVLTAEEYALYPHLGVVVKEIIGRMSGGGRKLSKQEVDAVVSQAMASNSTPEADH